MVRIGRRAILADRRARLTSQRRTSTVWSKWRLRTR